MAESNFIPFVGVSDTNALDYFTADDAIFPTVRPAGIVGRNNHPLITYVDAAEQNIHFAGVMGKDYNGGLIVLDIFWAAAAAVAGAVDWKVAWERENSGGPFDLDANTFAAQKTVTSVAPASSGELQKATLVFSQAEADGVAPGDPYRIRVRRDGGVAPDTMAGIAQLFRVTLEGV
jgi:hypothetical protein